ncbi:MAG: peptidoglycan D,D-transpeptidase FtsI family protein [Acidimicrobiia bacterium]
MAAARRRPVSRPRRPARGPQARLVAIAVLLLLAWVGMGVRLFEVQVVRAGEYAERGLAQRLVERPLAAARGTIFDRNGDPLAVTVEAHSIFARPGELTDPLYAAQQLGAVLATDYEDVLALLEQDESFVYLERQVGAETALAVAELELVGIESHPEAKRVYPAGPLTGQVVGLVDIDGLGVEGLEQQYEQVLRGTPGELVYEQAPKGLAIPQGYRRIDPAVPGDDLIITIDMAIQYEAEQACRSTLEITGAARCSVVVLSPETGEVLGLVNLPEFDPAARASTDGAGFSNFAVRGVYEPGSTQKLITVAAALEEGVVTPSTVIGEVADRLEVVEGACGSASEGIYGCFEDFESHETEDMTVRDIFTESSNVGTILVSQRLPDRALVEYMERFGQGTPTGIDYSGEAVGTINVDPTCGSCMASAAIGYSVAVTPLQMAAAFAAVANDGVWVQPHLVRSVIGASGATRHAEPETRRVVSEETAWVMRELLANVVERGTGGPAQVAGYRVGGKTGTANKIAVGGGYTDITVASFVGMAPIEDPQLVVAVVVDSPSWEYRTGKRAAAPAFAQIMEHSLHQLGIPPEGEADDG